MVHCQFNFLKLKHQQSKMKNQICFSVVFVLLLFLLLVTKWSCVEAQTCNSGTLTGKDPPAGQCNNTENDFYGLFGSLEREESRGEQRRGEQWGGEQSGMIPLHLVWMFLRLVRGKGVISPSPCLDVLKIMIERRGND